MNQGPALTTEPALISHRDTNALARNSLLAKTAKPSQTFVCRHRVEMEVPASLITRRGASLVRAKLATLVQSVKKTSMTVSRVLACQTLIAKIWIMVTVVSATLLTLETPVTYVSSEVFFM